MTTAARRASSARMTTAMNMSVPGFGDSCRPPIAHSPQAARPRPHPSIRAPAAGDRPKIGRAARPWRQPQPGGHAAHRSATQARPWFRLPAPRPASPRGRIPRRRSSLLSASHRTCSSSPSVRPYSDCEPPRASLRRAVKPAPLPGCTRRMGQSGEGRLDPGELRGRSAAHLPPPAPASAGKTQPGQGTRRTVGLAAAMARHRPRQRADAGRPHLGAVSPSACLENAGRLPTVTTVQPAIAAQDHPSAGQRYPPRIGFRSRALGHSQP